MKIVTIIGARPQFIKAAAVSRSIAAHIAARNDQQSSISEIIVHTGQHFDANMSDIFFEEMDIPKPDYHLAINSLSHGAMTGRMLEKIEEVLLKEKPDYVLVYGDTNSTLAGALAARKLHIKVVHVEAGLRSFNMNMPEEINRILTDRISDILCCPTETAVKNLVAEGFQNSDKLLSANSVPLVVNTGDVMYDAALHYSTFSAERSTVMKGLNLKGRKFVLCTIHRAENTDDPDRLKSIFRALVEINKDMRVVVPLHPRTRNILTTVFSGSDALAIINDALTLLDPVGYFDMVELLKHATMVMTDSGGLQKEAYFFGKPCITLRDETEWVELVDNGFNILASADYMRILACFQEMSSKTVDVDRALYGTGDASNKILNLFLH
ncbi:non-hydrolyzing UDP-N-acetylglucosamine 2-epimerase [Trichlorobacter lovleyi]|uniref:UDP-N-acetylglucosamine 2-epimerase n=1 Tax=Trichlorobacter lovleyi (strain ATCC BAA-1151 / DSM 17278 / SZ) TaxID=398767 RepID=B3E8V3_TRIL1|nr:UDP-N-acetylglucosamine 2-epimerase (non-hydrolyzing) [Trichlorobacter lovleyi]ACD95221.1 UDP-N-acetylglucosamine 2-epimerase [Trichlorobacter lovleyi SZ]